ncbi:MAG: hypothetical protein KGO81_02525 [Bacteroidota bacterium]|nr:hypothetical protein [Bacteroidota bacterium]
MANEYNFNEGYTGPVEKILNKLLTPAHLTGVNIPINQELEAPVLSFRPSSFKDEQYIICKRKINGKPYAGIMTDKVLNFGDEIHLFIESLRSYLVNIQTERIQFIHNSIQSKLSSSVINNLATLNFEYKKFNLLIDVLMDEGILTIEEDDRTSFKALWFDVYKRSCEKKATQAFNNLSVSIKEVFEELNNSAILSTEKKHNGGNISKDKVTLSDFIEEHILIQDEDSKVSRFEEMESIIKSREEWSMSVFKAAWLLFLHENKFLKDESPGRKKYSKVCSEFGIWRYSKEISKLTSITSCYQKGKQGETVSKKMNGLDRHKKNIELALRSKGLIVQPK